MRRPLVAFAAAVAISALACEPAVVFNEGPPVRDHSAPLEGGTLALTSDGRRAVAADPDTDRVWVADLAAWRIEKGIVLDSGSEPGRIALENDRFADLVLQNPGEVARIDLEQGTIVSRTRVCDEPRGLAWDAPGQRLYTACAGGDLVSFSPRAPAELTRIHLDGDLRDVVVGADGLWVSRFRSAQLLHLTRDGRLLERVSLPEISVTSSGQQTTRFEPGTAWRMISLPGGGVAMSHQGSREGPVTLTASGDPGASPYGSARALDETPSCDSLVESFLTVAQPGEPIRTMRVPGALPVDLAADPLGDRWAVVTAGTPGTTWATRAELNPPDEVPCVRHPLELSGWNMPVALAYRPDGERVLQVRPGALVLPERGMLSFPVLGKVDRGFDVFHTARRGNSLACASCHPDALDDGHTWDFAEIGPRRTPDLRGGISQRAPYHWQGDLPTPDDLMKEVFSRRMGGRLLIGDTEGVINWLDSVRPLHAPVADPLAAERGRKLFTSAATGCASCHNGALLSNDALVDVGTGGVFKVPSLVGVGQRVGLMHDGCAPTLRDRFGECGGGDLHGHTSELSPEQVGDLVAYLGSL